MTPLRAALPVVALASLLSAPAMPAAEEAPHGGSDAPAPGAWRWEEGLRTAHAGAEPANLTFAYWGLAAGQSGWWRLSLGHGLLLACDWAPGASHAELALGSFVLANGTCAMEHRARPTRVPLLVGVSFAGVMARGVCRELALPFAPSCDVQVLGIRPEVGDRIAGRGRFLAKAWHTGTTPDAHEVVAEGESAAAWPGSWAWTIARTTSADDPVRARLTFQWQRYGDGHVDGWWRVGLDHGGYTLWCSEDHAWASAHEEAFEGHPLGWGFVAGPSGAPLQEVACRLPVPPDDASFARPRTWGQTPGEPCARLPGTPPAVPVDCSSLHLDELDGGGLFFPPAEADDSCPHWQLQGWQPFMSFPPVHAPREGWLGADRC